ncbi:hypothetical protein ACHAQJ_006202 [Trichoderma viride]
MASFGPYEGDPPSFVPYYFTSDGQPYRNLLGDALHVSVYRRARQYPNLESPSANFWSSQIQTDFPQSEGYQWGAEHYTSKEPGREGDYERTDRALWRADPRTLTLTEELILEAKSDRMSLNQLLGQALRDAKEIVRTRSFERMHVITTTHTSFHAWLYTAGSEELESLFAPRIEEEKYLEASEPEASLEWFYFVQSVKSRPNIMKAHPSLILRSNATRDGGFR